MPDYGGDVEGLGDIGALYRAFAGDLYRYGIWLVGEPARAEDLVQETFLRAQEKGHLFEIDRRSSRGCVGSSTTSRWTRTSAPAVRSR